MTARVAKLPMKTRMIRTPVTGPDPANTLVHLEGKARAFDEHGASYGEWRHDDVEFRTEFRIDGYQQQIHDWYEENTQVSATAMLRMLNTETDLIFTFAVDALQPFLDLDGTLGFTINFREYIDDDAWFPESGLMTQMGVSVSAYVLCYEPRPERPPSGGQRTVWDRRDQIERDVVLPKAARPSRSRAGSKVRRMADCDDE